MKSERSFLRSARASHRRIARDASRILVESKRLASVPIMDTPTDQSLETNQAAAAVPHPVECMGEKVATKRPSNAIDPEKLLQFSQQLYAHALTLQEVIRNDGEVAYDVLRPRCNRQAAKQFEIFYRAGDEPATKPDFEPAANRS
ncbi:MAG: hypothetical protein WCA13_01590 [Terriglobales bacterium]